ncbi:hypothetical protein MMC25_002548 [Agyrium rufum]|nr:hypothetical protein [Agyrium rufum]
MRRPGTTHELPHADLLLGTEDTSLQWRYSGLAPFPVLNLPYNPSWHKFPLQDLRHLHHICTISSGFEASRMGKAALWGSELPRFLRLGYYFDFVAYASMALSASRLAWMTRSIDADNTAAYYQIKAMKGVRLALAGEDDAVRSRSAEAVLCASILLSIQVHEWRSWKILSEGIVAVVKAMGEWKTESSLLEYLEAQRYASFADLVEDVTMFPVAIPQKAALFDYNQLLEHATRSLEVLEKFVVGQTDLEGIVRRLYDFVEHVRGIREMPPLAMQFKLMHPLRGYLNWLPASVDRIAQGEAIVSVTLAHFYAVGLTVTRVFPIVDHIHFVNIRIAGITAIKNILDSSAAEALDPVAYPVELLALMAFPLEAVAAYSANLTDLQNAVPVDPKNLGVMEGTA